MKRENELDEVAMTFWVLIYIFLFGLLFGFNYEEIRWENHFWSLICGEHVFGSRERRRGV